MPNSNRFVSKPIIGIILSNHLIICDFLQTPLICSPSSQSPSWSSQRLRSRPLFFHLNASFRFPVIGPYLSYIEALRLSVRVHLWLF